MEWPDRAAADGVKSAPWAGGKPGMTQSQSERSCPLCAWTLVTIQHNCFYKTKFNIQQTLTM